MKLNLGSGYDYRKGWVNVEQIKSIKADLYFNLNSFPYPFKDNSIEEIRLSNILEHLSEPIKTLQECVRIASNDCILTLIVPHARGASAFGDLQHKNFFTDKTFTPLLLEEYGLTELKLESIKFISSGNINHWKNYIPFRRQLSLFISGLYDEIEFIFKIKK